MKAALIQHDIVWEDGAATRARLEPLVADAAASGADVVVLPEMFAVGFSMEVASVAEPTDGPTTAWLSATARAHGVMLVGGVPIAIDGTFENHALAVAPDGSLLARYAKIHPFSMAGEDDHFRAGKRPVVFDWRGMRFGLAVCYDLRFPELYRRLMRLGATCTITIANWPDKRVAHWDTLLEARALENVSYAIGVNRTGRGGKLVYPGSSALVRPNGTVAVRGGDREGVLLAELSPSEVRDVRAALPFLDDVRADLFPDLFSAPATRDQDAAR